MTTAVLDDPVLEDRADDHLPGEYRTSWDGIIWGPWQPFVSVNPYVGHWGPFVQVRFMVNGEWEVSPIYDWPF